jgi:hypothetical protein
MHGNAELHRQYFQNIPVSRLIMSEYSPMYLTEIMLPNVTLLNTCDPSYGDVYSGDMRAYTVKILISLGIDIANYGENSSSGSQELTSYTTPLITAHNSVGMYCNEGLVIQWS